MFGMKNMKARASAYRQGRQLVLSKNVGRTSYASSNAIQQRVYKSRVAGRQGTYQIPRGFVGLAGDAKYIDIAKTAYPMGSNAAPGSGNITYLNTITQGTSVTKRVGKSVRCQSLSVRGAVVAGSTGTVATYHIYYIWDYQPNMAAAVPAYTDFFTSQDDTSLPNRANNARFKILAKITGTVTGNSTAPATGLEVQWIEKIVPMPTDGFTMYNEPDLTGALDQCIQGALYQVCISTALTGNTAPVFTSAMRLNFQDLC